MTALRHARMLYLTLRYIVNGLEGAELREWRRLLSQWDKERA